MRRARWIAAAIVGGSVCGTTSGYAQTPSPEGWVVLSVDEYRLLRDRSLGIGPPPVAAPVDGTLSRIDYNLRVEGESIAGQALLTIDVLREGWVRIPIPAGLMVRDARTDTQPVSIVEDSPPYLLLSRSGRVVVSLELVVPVTSTSGTESLALPASPAPITHATLVLPRNGVDLALTGGFIGEHVEATDESRWTMYGRPNEAMTLSWKRRVDDRRATLPLRIRGRINELVGLGEEASQVSTSVRIDVVQGLMQEIALAIPMGLVVTDVKGATVADWQTTDGALRVRLLEPVSSEASFIVEGEMRAPRDGRIVVPIVRIPSAERESGGIAVDVAGAGEIGARQANGLEPADPSDLGDFVAAHDSPSLVAFRMRPIGGSEPRSLAVTVVRYTPQAVLVANVEEARYRALVADGRVLVDARYAIRNNQRSFLKIVLPAGSTVWSAVVNDRPIRPGVSDAAVLLPLDKGRVGEDAPTFVVKLVYFQRISSWREGERATIDLPAVDLPISRTGLRLHYPPDVRVSVRPGGSFRVEYDSGPFAEALRQSAMHSAPNKEFETLAAARPASPDLQNLVDRFRKEDGERTVVGAIPVEVSFPEFGPSIFLASELTAEGRAPSAELNIKQARD